jgi:hypothetical protein
MQKGAAPCAFEMVNLMSCYIDSSFVEARCSQFKVKYEECMKMNNKITMSKTWQYRRVLKKMRLGAL